MGISAGGSNSGPKSDINVTPLVDVVLVLLIIFLVTMPVLMRHITIEVPREMDVEQEFTTATQITVLAKADGSLVINDGTSDTTINRVDLAKTLRPLLEKKRTEKIVFVDFEDQLHWTDAVSVMDTIKGLGKRAENGESDVKVALKIREEKAPVAPLAPAAP